MKEDAGNGWTRHSVMQTIKMHRSGWRGLLDALVAVFTRSPRLSVPADVVFSVFAKGGDVRLQVMQVEFMPKSAADNLLAEDSMTADFTRETP